MIHISIKQRILAMIWLFFTAMSLESYALSSSDTLIIPFSYEADSSFGLPETEWARASWQSLNSLDSIPDHYPTGFRMVYSTKGLHVRIHGKDMKVTSGFVKDGEELYLGDVLEVFLHPEPSTPIYFEYEVNAHDRELVLLIPNLDGRVLGWLPWRYEGGRRVVKKVRIERVGDAMTGWSVELFIPYALLAPLQNIPPVKGTVWHMNVCRLDYDAGRMMKWSWSPVRRSFHEYRVFRPILFD